MKGDSQPRREREREGSLERRTEQQTKLAAEREITARDMWKAEGDYNVLIEARAAGRREDRLDTLKAGYLKAQGSRRKRLGAGFERMVLASLGFSGRERAEPNGNRC